MFDTDIEKNRNCIILEPPRSIKKFIYLCDNRYHTEYIEPLYRTYTDNGLIIITGESVKMYHINGDEYKSICKSSVRISKNQRKGGQSAPRFGRIRDNEIQQYISKCAELARRSFTIDDIPNIEKLVIAGMAEKKDKLCEILHPKLKEICSKITISDKESLQDILDKCHSIFDKDNTSLTELENFMEHFNRDTGKAVYGKKDVLKALNDYGLEKLLVHELYDDTENKKDAANKFDMKEAANKFDMKEAANKFDMKEDLEKICETHSCQYIKIVDLNDKTNELLEGFGGIVGLRWY